MMGVYGLCRSRETTRLIDINPLCDSNCGWLVKKAWDSIVDAAYGIGCETSKSEHKVTPAFDTRFPPATHCQRSPRPTIKRPNALKVRHAPTPARSSERLFDPWEFDWSGFLNQPQSNKTTENGAADSFWCDLRLFLIQTATRNLSPALSRKMDASDIVQKSMLEVHSGITGFKGTTPAEFRAWMIRIVDNNVIDAGRQFQKTQSRDIAREVPLDRDDLGSGLAGSHRTASSVMRRDETDVELIDAIAKLPKRRQRILELRHYEGLAYAEIGTEMGLSELAARKLYSRTIVELRKLMSFERPRSAK